MKSIALRTAPTPPRARHVRSPYREKAPTPPCVLVAKELNRKVELGVDWSVWDAKLGTKHDRDLARDIGCTEHAVKTRRMKKRVRKYKSPLESRPTCVLDESIRYQRSKVEQLPHNYPDDFAEPAYPDLCMCLRRRGNATPARCGQRRMGALVRGGELHLCCTVHRHREAEAKAWVAARPAYNPETARPPLRAPTQINALESSYNTHRPNDLPEDFAEDFALPAKFRLCHYVVRLDRNGVKCRPRRCGNARQAPLQNGWEPRLCCHKHRKHEERAQVWLASQTK